MYYIQECKKEEFLRKIFYKIKKENEKIELPINKSLLLEKDRLSLKYIKCLSGKIKKIVKEDTVVLSKNLKKNKELMENLNICNINIFDGKWLYRYILIEIIEYILKCKNEKKENTEISILVNYIDDVVIENIKIFAKIFKRVNIITNHIEKLKKIEENLYEEDGIIITVSNNKRKSLVKSKLILNLDFSNELINKFKIFDEAIIISIEEEIKINIKRYLGIIVNDYEIILPNELDLIEEYSTKEVFESLIYRKDSFFNIREQIEKNGVIIKELIGRNGIIKFD